MTAAETRQEHTASWYAASARYAALYPELRDTLDADVCVVGGGFTGVATALTLAERGHSVVLLEANRVGWGASGRNGGQMIHGFGNYARLRRLWGEARADLLWELAWRGHDIIHERVRRYGIDCDLTSGYVEMATKPSRVRGLEREAERLARRGHPWPFRLLNRGEMGELVGTDRYHGGLLTERDGHLHPLNLCAGEAHAAAGLGVRIFEQSPVTGIRHGERPQVVTDRGSVRAHHVVLAGNAYHHLEPGRLRGTTFPAGSYIIATEPLPKDLQRQLNPRNLAFCDNNEILEYHRLSADGRLLYGGRCNYSGRDPRDIAASIRPRMLRVFPDMRDYRIDYRWGGKIGIVLNRIPLLGCIGGNVWFAQGYSGHGVNATHIVGGIMADALEGETEIFDLFANIRHQRIPGSQKFGNQMVAMGMLYYRLKDWLG